MSAIKNTALRNKMATDFGVLFNGGVLRIRNSTNQTLVSFTLATPAFGTAADGAINLAGVPIVAQGVLAGSAHNAVLESTGAVHVLSGLTVGMANAHVILDNVNIAVGQIVSLNQLTWTVPAAIANP